MNSMQSALAGMGRSGELQAQTCGNARQSVASELMQRMNTVADRSQALAEMTYAKLNPIMLNTAPCPPGMDAGNAVMEYPPLFNEYRAQMQRIESALAQIEDAISRTEL